ncbi:Hydrogen cyanide synthase subunit HcnC [subsurface metagenome]
MIKKSNFDAVIIGGGVIGVFCTYFLSKAGMKVGLFEKGDIASGASGGCDGNIMAQDHQPGYDTNLTVLSNKMYKELLKELDWDIEYTEKGSILVIETEDELQFMLERMKQQLACGLPVRYINPNELYKQEPLLAPGFLGAIECASDASCMPIQVVIALARRARKLGAEIHTFEEIKDIKLDKNGKISGIITSESDVSAPIVVNCCGAWAPFVGKLIGLDIPIKPRRGQLVVVEQAAQVGHRKISEARYIVAKFHPELAEGTDSDMVKYGVAFVLEPTASGNILLGSCREFAGYDTRTTLPAIRAIVKRAVRFIPSLKYLHCIRTYAGLRPYTPDHLSIVSQVDEVPGFYIAAGAEGDGIGIAPITGLTMSQIILKQETNIDVNPLRWARFSQVQ